MVGSIYSLTPPLDLISDGLPALIVVTSRGLHFMQPNQYAVLEIVRSRLDKFIAKSFPNEKDLSKLIK